MAPAGCTLDDSGLAEQLDRYRQLGTTALRIQERELGLVVTFTAEVDVALLHETVAMERDCCSFFTLDYDASERRLSIAIDDPARGDALRSLLCALRGSPSPLARWSRQRFTATSACRRHVADKRRQHRTAEDARRSR